MKSNTDSILDCTIAIFVHCVAQNMLKEQSLFELSHCRQQGRIEEYERHSFEKCCAAETAYESESDSDKQYQIVNKNNTARTKF